MADPFAAPARLDGLGDDCRLRAIPCDPPLDGEGWSALAAGLAKLFAQFAREGRVEASASELAGGGAVVLVGWQGADLSGCSHDALNRLLQAHERDGRRLLSAPPFVVEVGGAARCVDRAGLRSLVADGTATEATPVYDLGVSTVGAWRTAGRIPLARLHGGRWVSAAG